VLSTLGARARPAGNLCLGSPNTKGKKRNKKKKKKERSKQIEGKGPEKPKKGEES
jgi:hypothetical protein